MTAARDTTGIGSHATRRRTDFPQRHSLKEVIELGKKAIDWDRKWHAPGAVKLPNGRMHGLGFVHINEWSWMAGRQFGCLILREGKVHIIGERADFGMDTESAFRQCVAAEAGLRYEDTVIQVQRSDASAYQFWVPGGSMGIGQSTPQLVLAARELKKKILSYAVRPRPAAMMPMPMMGGTQPMFPGKKVEELDVRDGYVFEKANPANRKTVKEVANAFWGEDPAIVHPIAPNMNGPDAERETASGDVHHEPPGAFHGSGSGHRNRRSHRHYTSCASTTSATCSTAAARKPSNTAARSWAWEEARRKKKSIARAPESA